MLLLLLQTVHLQAPLILALAQVVLQFLSWLPSAPLLLRGQVYCLLCAAASSVHGSEAEPRVLFTTHCSHVSLLPSFITIPHLAHECKRYAS